MVMACTDGIWKEDSGILAIRFVDLLTLGIDLFIYLFLFLLLFSGFPFSIPFNKLIGSGL